ncbi:MAG: hypothetical protein QOH76_3981 [Thermoleophilaceae bacterium]|jgi:hypothetical protein|nr:hypothetical protein [Thermoleophilaceae bacterium]
MRRRDKNTDRLGVALLVGAAIGFIVGLLDGFSSPALDAPVVLPFAGAAIGVLVAGVGAGLFAWLSRRRSGPPEPKELERDRLRHEAREGWVEGIDLTDPPPRPPRRTPRLDP